MPRKPGLVVGLGLLVFSGALLGQVPGDTQDAVRARLGAPQLSRRTGAKEIWMYRNSVRVTFENGVVTSVSGPGGATASTDAPTVPAGVPTASAAASAAEGSSPGRSDPQAPAATTAVVYRDDVRHIRFTLPAGFERVQPSDPKLFAAWVRGTSADKDLLAVTLAEVPGRLAKGPLPAGMLPAGRTSFMVSWRGESLNCVRLEENTADGRFLNLNLVLPTEGKVLRLGFAGRTENERGVRELLDQTLKSLEVSLVYGPPPMDSAERLGMILGSIVCIAAAATVLRRMLNRTMKRSAKEPPVLGGAMR